MLWLTIALSALLTFALRFAFFSKLMPIKIGTRAYRLLQFTAPSILTAMWMPILIMPKDQLWISVHNPYLLAGCVAILLSIFVRKTIWIVIISLFAFLLLKQLG